jgi:hypothetical protein
VTTGVITKRDSRSVLVAANAAQSRLGAYIVPANCVLASSSTSVTLWLNDDKHSESVHATEIRWIRFDPDVDSIVVEFVSFPENWSRTSRDLADTEYAPDADFAAVRSSFATRGMIGSLTLVDRIDSASIGLDAAALSAKHITFRLGFLTYDGSEELDLSSTIRIHVAPSH